MAGWLVMIKRNNRWSHMTFLSRGHVRSLDKLKIISSSARRMATKFGRVENYGDGNLTMKLHEPLTTCSLEVT